MSRLISRTLGAAVVAAALLATTGAARASWIPPHKSPMVDAAGQTNGCVAKVRVGFERDGGIPGVKVAESVTCPADAGLLRVRYNYKMYEVASDGSQTLFVDSTPGSQGGTGKSTTFLPCDFPGIAGTHTWLVRGRMNTKTAQGDTHPYVGVVAVQATLTCPT